MKSESLCTGVIGDMIFEDQFNHEWINTARNFDPCLLFGFTVLHKFSSGEVLERAFNFTRNATIQEFCSSEGIRGKTLTEFRMRIVRFGNLQSIKEFQNNFDNFFRKKIN